MVVKAEDCAKFERCNANVCPFDEQWRRRTHVDGEPVCFWLREWVKAGGEQRVGERLGAEQVTAIREVAGVVCAEGHALPRGLGDVRRTLRRVAQSSSLLDPDRLARLSRGRP